MGKHLAALTMEGSPPREDRCTLEVPPAQVVTSMLFSVLAHPLSEL